MKKYNKYAHHKKKKWRSCTLKFIIDFTAKYKKEGTQVDIWLEPRKHFEDLHISEGVDLTGIKDQNQGMTSKLVDKEVKWPPKIIQKEF